jgi:hypothetical protein
MASAGDQQDVLATVGAALDDVSGGHPSEVLATRWPVLTRRVLWRSCLNRY